MEKKIEKKGEKEKDEATKTTHSSVGVLALLVNPSSSVVILHEEGARRRVAAVSAPDARVLIDVHEPAESTPRPPPPQ